MYSPRHARPSCLPVRAATAGGLTAVLLPIAMAAPALATTTSPSPSPTTSTSTTTSGTTTTTATTTASPTASSTPAPTSATTTAPAALPQRTESAMRISASRIQREGTSRIGVRLLDASGHLGGQEVVVQVPGSTGWTDVARLTTDADGLAVGHLRFAGETAVRAVFAGTATHASSTSPEAKVLNRTASVMRISASETGTDNRSRIGVRLLSGDQPVRGTAVAIEMLADDGVWRYHGQATTDGEGLAVVRLPFVRDTRVRSTFSGSDTARDMTSPEAVVTFNTLGQQAVQIASEQAGKPYQYGSTGPSRFDCSGFTTYIFKTRLGRGIPRTSAEQAASLPQVAQSAKRPGDLLFFRTSGRVTHVGVYAGGGSMWAAPTTGDRVKLQSIYTSSYTVGRVG